MAVLVAINRAFALTEVKWDNSSGGSFTEKTNWSGDALPVQNENYFTMDLDADYTVTIPSGYYPYSGQFRTPLDAANEGKRLTLDAADAVVNFYDPETDGTVANAYNGEPFKFYGSSGHFFNWEGWNNKCGPAVLTNAHIQVWQDKDAQGRWASHFVLDRGSLFQREGMVGGNVQRGAVVIGHAVADNNQLEIRFSNNSTSYFSNVNARMRAALSQYIVEGGSYNRVFNDFHFPAVDEDNSYTNEVVVRGENSYMQVGNMIFLSGASSNRTVSTYVTNNATMYVNQLRFKKAGRGLLHVSDGGTFRLNSIACGAVGDFLAVKDGHFDLEVVDGGVLEIADNADWGKSATAENTTANLIVSNAVIRQVANGNHGLRMNRDWTPGPNTRIELSGFMFLSSDTVNNEAITIDFSNCEVEGDGHITIGENDPVNFVMTNGSMVVKEIYVGAGADAETDIFLGGDAYLRVTGGNGSEIGNQGAVHITVTSNAVFDVGYLRIGRNDCAATTREVVLDIVGGGRVVCTNSQINVCDGGRVTRIRLQEGGELFSRQMMGWNGGAWNNNQYGWAYLEGDGGVVRAPSGGATVVGRFDEAVVTAKGLEIASDYDVWINQKFVDKEGSTGSGRVILSGSGVKNINGVQRDNYTPPTSTHSFTECVGGTTLFNAAASWNTHLVVSNNATVSFAGANTGMTLKGLTLGDADTYGELRLDTGDQLVVDGPVSIVNGRIALTSTAAKGDYDLLKVKDPDVNFPAASRDQWTQMLVSAGSQAGYSYRFTSAVVDGDLVLTLNVDDKIPLEGSVVWTSQSDDDWATGANWDAAAKPGALEIAEFTRADAVKDVDVAGNETIGAMRFASDEPYTVGGEGRIAFSFTGNEFVANDRGTNVVEAALSGHSLAVTNAAGTKLMIAGQVSTVSGMTKTGPGNLTVPAPANVSGGINLAEGVLALGAPGGGPVTYDGAMRFTAATARTPVAIKTEAPVTLTDFSATTGLLVKFGVDPLVISGSSGTVRPSSGEGPEGNQVIKQDFALSDLAVPTNGCGALTVAEGRLVCRGTAESADDVNFDNANQVVVGLDTPACGATPELVIDHTRFVAGKHCYFPGYYDGEDSPWSDVRLTITNGAYARFDTFHGFPNVDRVDTAKRPTYHVDLSGGSALHAWYACNLLHDRDRAAPVITVREGSLLLAGASNNENPGFTVNGDLLDATFTGASHMGAPASDWSRVAGPCKLSLNGSSFNCHFRFLDNSVFHCNRLYYGAGANWATNYLHFANGEWDPGAGDFDFVFQNGNRIAVDAEGAGLKLNPASGDTWTLRTIVTGTDLVKGGEGTLVVDRAMYLTSGSLTTITTNTVASATLAFTGALRVNEGAVRFADGLGSDGTCSLAVASGATVDLNDQTVAFAELSGPGTVENGTLRVGRIVYADEKPNFSGVVFDGETRVDFEHTEESPMDYDTLHGGVVVATYEGDAPVLGEWRAVNTGFSALRSRVVARDGVITLYSTHAGMTLLFR